jgi:hypothetical protein
MEDNVERLDENKGLSDEETVAVATDEELSAAFDELVQDIRPRDAETPPVEEFEPEIPEEKPPKVEPTEEEKARHAEESRLGRKVARLEGRLESVATKDDLLKIMERLDDLGRGRREPTTEIEQFGEEELHTPEGIRTFIQEEEKRKAKAFQDAQKQYVSGYFQTLDDLMTEVDDPAVRKIIKAEMIKPGGEANKRYSDVPARDCAKNFTRALKIAQEKVKPAPTTFDKDGRVPKVPVGVTGSTTGSKSTETLKHDLDEYSKALVKDGKLTIEEINAALDGDAPINLGGRKHSAR